MYQIKCLSTCFLLHSLMCEYDDISTNVVGGKKFELDRNTTFIWNEYRTYIGNVWNTLLQLTYWLLCRWMQTTRGIRGHTLLVNLKALRYWTGHGERCASRSGLRDRGTNQDSEREDRQMARSHDVKVKGLKNTIGSVTKQIGLSILGLPLETNYFAQPQTNLFSDGQRKCLLCTYTNDQLQTQSTSRGTFYANGSTTHLI